MRGTVIIATFFLGLGLGLGLAPGLGIRAASAQQSPMSTGPVGTPITPQQLGNWGFSTELSQSEAQYDARAQGFVPERGLREDEYGDWFGHSARGGFVVFPDGRVFPL